MERLTYDELAELQDPGETEIDQWDVDNAITFVVVDRPGDPGRPFVVDLRGVATILNADISSADFGGETYVEFTGAGTPVQGGTVVITSGDRTYSISIGV